MSSVTEYYGLPRLLDSILNALRAQGKDTDHLTVDDLAAVANIDRVYISSQ